MRRKHRKLTSSADLDITPFMNLMIVLVPVLLLGMVFSQIRMIELDFPGMEAGQAPSPEDFQLVVALIPEGIEVIDSKRGVIRAFPLREGVQDFEGLRHTLRQIKKRMPDKTDVVLEVSPEIDYQTLVRTMDTVRSYPAVVAASAVVGELFPDVSLSDAAEGRRLTRTQEGA
jgi:biopolymer transport protein ExbD